MVGATLISRWRSRIPDLSAAIMRFPLAVVLAAILTAYMLYQDTPGDIEDRIMGALAGAFLWVVAVDLYVESQLRPFAVRIALGSPAFSSSRFCFGLRGKSGFSSRSFSARL